MKTKNNEDQELYIYNNAKSWTLYFLLCIGYTIATLMLYYPNYLNFGDILYIFMGHMIKIGIIYVVILKSFKLKEK